MRTFGLTINGTVTAASEEAALALVERRLPGRLGNAISIDGAEVTDQICIECWCYVDDDSTRCAGCSPRSTDGEAVDHIARMLRAPEWDSAADYLEAIAATIQTAGRELGHAPDCDGCGAWPADGCSAPGREVAS